jgi:hypothetical protein
MVNRRYENHIKPELQYDSAVDPAKMQIHQGKQGSISGFWLFFRLPGQARHVSFHATRQLAEAAYQQALESNPLHS